MINLLMLGGQEENIPYQSSNMVVVLHSPGIANGMSSYEYYIKCKNMADYTDILILQSDNNRVFSNDEVILIDTVYTMKKPIFCVGNTSICDVLSFAITNWFRDFEALFMHIQKNY
ncbi:hypothetical protein ACSVDA_11840 [Cytobacillus sp. Hm23]